MKRRIPYWLYKTGYSQFPADDYDKLTKTIEVDIPPMKRRVWPKSWLRPGTNHMITEKGVEIYFWNSGIQQNYFVREPYKRFGRRERTIPAGFDAFDRVMQTVKEFEASPNL